MKISAKFLASGLACAAFMLPAQGSAQHEIEIEGAISGVNGTTIQLFNGLVSVEALGAEIETDDEQFTNVSDIKVGAWVELEAKTTADGRIQATSVEVSDEKEDDSEIGGVIGTVDNAPQVFTIGPITIAWNDSTKFKNLSRPVGGRLVEVAVEVSAGRLVATSIDREEADD